MHSLSHGLHLFEIGVAILSIVFVAIGLFYLSGEILHFTHHVQEHSLHHVLEELLADILLLVIGIELAIMLIRRTPESLVEVMFFVIAFKMLIETTMFYELIIGVAALAGLFAVRKYLEYISPEQRLAEEGD
jgi:hypothetical protein